MRSEADGMSWFSRVKNALRPGRVEAEIDEELQEHLAARTRQWVAEGMRAEDAAAKARREFGNVTRLRERGREMRLSVFVESTVQDVRFALRGMRKNRTFYVTAALSLGIAIGAVTAIYAIVAAAVLRPLPVRQPEQLVQLWTASDGGEAGGRPNPTFSYPLLQDLRAAAGEMADLELFGWSSPTELFSNSGGVNPKAIRQHLSGGALRMLGVKPAMGRLLGPGDDQLPTGSDVAVISDSFWQRRFGRDPNVLGKLLRTSDRSYRVVGVTEPGFFGVEPGKFVDFWVPAATYDPKSFHNYHYHWLFAMGRLRAGTRAELAARLQPVYQRVERRDVTPDLAPRIRRMIESARIYADTARFGFSQFREHFEIPMRIVFAIAAGLMLIACTNVASLLLARGTARTAELAMRVSLGASRLRLLRQLLTESVVLGLMAGGLGWLLARLMAPLLVSGLSTQHAPVQFALYLDSRILLACCGFALLASLLFGGVPAWQFAGIALAPALRSSSGQASKLHLGRWFLSAQVAGSFCLVVAGAAFLLTLWNLLAFHKGFEAGQVTMLDIGNEHFGMMGEAKQDTARQLLERLRGRPGMLSVSAAQWPIFLHMTWTESILVGKETRNDRSEYFYPVSEEYFQTLRTRLLAGRVFAGGDSQKSPVIPSIVNVALARRYFHTQDVVGKEFRRAGGDHEYRHQIVGLVEDAAYSGLREGAEPVVYVPMDPRDAFTLYVRSPLDTGDVLRLVQTEAAALGTHVRQVTSLETLVGNSVLREKLLAGLGGAFGGFSLLLAAVGVFGLLNYSVARRTKELGIRSALGASRRHLAGLVSRDLAQLMLAGVAVGLGASLLLMPLLKSLLFGMQAVDPAVMVVAAVSFLLVALAAGGLPARRAATIDPNMALRDE